MSEKAKPEKEGTIEIHACVRHGYIKRDINGRGRWVCALWYGMEYLMRTKGITKFTIIHTPCPECESEP